jgi:hypothetical protein
MSDMGTMGIFNFGSKPEFISILVSPFRQFVVKVYGFQNQGFQRMKFTVFRDTIDVCRIMDGFARAGPRAGDGCTHRNNAGLPKSNCGASGLPGTYRRVIV